MAHGAPSLHRHYIVSQYHTGSLLTSGMEATKRVEPTYAVFKLSIQFSSTTSFPIPPHRSSEALGPADITGFYPILPYLEILMY
ncbi:hypothetical protein AB205_0200550 [Aquarana catesbeiana]|uniref:Uncharacterized protein n=1 Tax=Aquarana catesbeiana TaxID=8400 RepID=A0A2G9QGM4_AQUCT|nr:hypothetical protein AB205_0200550 [Aquarana catesbeiana]